MFFHTAELEHHPIRFDVSYQDSEIELSAGLRLIEELRSSGVCELLRNTEGELRVRGSLKAVVAGQCDRCLEEARVDVSGDFDLFFRPAPKDNPCHLEVHLGEGEIDLSFYDGDGISLRDALREYILLSLPMRLLCRPDCAGLCPVCGGNRNLAACGCGGKRPDPRWEALRKL